MQIEDARRSCRPFAESSRRSLQVSQKGYGPTKWVHFRSGGRARAEEMGKVKCLIGWQAIVEPLVQRDVA
jgi:hypothetical protein